ncbi:MAG: 4'-phosphopantetheinyl transferase superfamily protein [Bacteroidetes bacterium]|jgi:phosphopantetheinyl transferase|nr:4'-phosphopantetheinyl transferase superfamily protein [Bacteroidota bacterium]
MPLYRTIIPDSQTKVLIWKIEESFEALSKEITLTDKCELRVQRMKSDIHKRGFLSIRKLLEIEGYSDFDLYYDENGKPHLKDGKFISITHSYEFAAIIISDSEVGIDIEKQRSKIIRIAHKFTPLEEYRTLANDDALMRKLTIVWCAKESLYKSFAERGVSFLRHIDVADFDLDENQTTAKIVYGNRTAVYEVHFFEFEGFTCAYTFNQKI